VNDVATKENCLCESGLFLAGNQTDPTTRLGSSLIPKVIRAAVL
jgi:hypothetical protein